MKRPGQTRCSSAWSRRGSVRPDAHVRQQLMPTPLPAILGHEGAGIVVRTGTSVTHLKPGDHVVTFLPLVRTVQTLPVVSRRVLRESVGGQLCGCKVGWLRSGVERNGGGRPARPFLRPILVRDLCACASAQHHQGAQRHSAGDPGAARLRLPDRRWCNPEGNEGSSRRHGRRLRRGRSRPCRDAWPPRSPTRRRSLPST